MNDQTDQQLLRTHAVNHSEAAFTELVRRHVDLVYSAALRMICDGHLAQDVTQAVFVTLAQNAKQLTDHPVLSGWLHRTAQNLASKTIRTDVRRRAREQEAVAMNELLATGPDASWEQIAPHLDAALGELSEPDRDALLLRYFEKKSAIEMAERLGVSAEAAQKRVTRAVERLRELFTKRGVTVGTSGLAVVISANAVQAAPIGLALTISTAAALTTTTLVTTASVTVTKAIAMTALQKTLVTVTVVALAGTSIYEARQASQLRDQVQTLQQQQRPSAEEIQHLWARLGDATNQLEHSLAENSRLRADSRELELLRLRGQVARLKNDTDQAHDPFVQKALTWRANAEKIKQYFATHPEQQVPEMKLLDLDRQIFNTAMSEDLDSESGTRKALSRIRFVAKNSFAEELRTALQKYIATHQDQLPSQPTELLEYLGPKETYEPILERYKMLHSGKFGDLPESAATAVMTDIALVDSVYDKHWFIGPKDYSPEADVRINSIRIPEELLETLKAYVDANHGQLPTDLNNLKPYVKTIEQQAAFLLLVPATSF